VQDVIGSLAPIGSARSRINLYALAQEEQGARQTAINMPRRSSVFPAHRLAKGSKVLVAVIDSEVDATHPELAGAIVGKFDASSDEEKLFALAPAWPERIAARRTMVAPPAVGCSRCGRQARSNSAEGTRSTPQRARLGGREGRPRRQYELCRPSDPRLKMRCSRLTRKAWC